MSASRWPSQAARSGFRVTGLDLNAEIVAGLMAGRSHVDDVTDGEVAEMLGHGFRATTDETADRTAGRHRDLRADPAVRGRPART